MGFGALNIAPPVLITLLLVLTRMSGPAGQIQQAAGQLAHDLPAYEKLRELEEELAAIPREATLEDPAAKLPDLLVGLFPPQAGKILIGDTVLDGATLVPWRARVSYVAQDPFLFHDTIRRNLSWVNSQAAEEDLWAALTIAGAEVLVRRMKVGLDTMVGERGTLISGGERQRIALARAVLRKPRLLILDEATSAIDIAGEREVIGRFLKIPTIVMIAHRAESLALCDRVLRLEAGRFVSDSRPGEL